MGEASNASDPRMMLDSRDPECGEVTVSSSGSLRGAYQLRTSMRVARNRDEVFGFFSNPANLESITPPWLNFEIVSELPICMGEGVRIDYKLRLHGIPLEWRSRISRWRPPCEFIDEQLHGPYRLWRHRHLFEEHADETEVRDVVDYQVAGGWLIDRLFVRRDLDRIFRYRQCRITELLAASPQSAPDRMLECP